MASRRSMLLFLLFLSMPGFAAVTVTSPLNNATVTSPVQYAATSSTATCTKGVATMGIYVNNQKLYVSKGSTLSYALALSPGKYQTVVEEWDYCGGASVAHVAITVPTQTTPPPVTMGVSVTSPLNNSTVTSPVNFVATAATSTCSKGVASMGIYVNNVKDYVVSGTKMNTSLTLANGTQHITVEEWDKCGGAAFTHLTLTVAAKASAAVNITANPTSISSGGSSTLTVSASNATQVSIAGSDSSTYTLPSTGGTQTVHPTTTTIYTVTATGTSGNATAATTVTVAARTLSSIAVTPAGASLAVGATQQFTATGTYSDSSTSNVSASASWTSGTPGVATITSAGLATAVASGSTQITATLNSISGSTSLAVTQPSTSGVNVPTWHFDAQRSGLNANEQSLSPANVSPQTFGKLFSYLVDGYVYGEPLLVSGLTVNGAPHNVVFVATEYDSVYAFDADNYGDGSPLWQVSLLRSGETPQIAGADVKPFQGVTSTPVIDPKTNTMYVVSAQTPSSGNSTFRLSALDITTGAQKFGGPVTIQASVPGTGSASVNGVDSLNTSCVQRTALLLANGTVYMGFSHCHSGWLLAYDAQSLSPAGVFDVSPNLDGEGQFASAGGIWMGGGGPVADSAGNIYVTTGNGPWDGKTAFSDSILKFDSKLNRLDYFTPNAYQYMDCADADLAAGGLMLIPGTTQLLAGGKTGKLYMVSTSNLGQETANDTGATQTLWFEPSLSAPYTSTCTDSGGVETTQINSFEIFGTAAYFNGSVYLGVTPTSSTAPAGIGQFTYSGGTLTPKAYTSQSIQQNNRGTTPFLSANGNTNGVMWMIDAGQPLGSPEPPTNATLRAYDATNLADQLYNSGQNSADTPGYGIKFSSPIVANGKVYINTGHDLVTATKPQGELDVYGLK